MRKKLLYIVGSMLVVLLGIATAALATHTVQTETHTVPFTIGDVTGAVTLTDEDQLPHETVVVTETVTVTVTETTPPPPPPPPTPTSNCLVSNRAAWTYDQCDFNTLIEVTNRQWTCTQPLSAYGPLPIKVVAHFTQPVNDSAAISWATGCSGDSNPDTIDIIMVVEGDGASGTSGIGHDSFKTRGFSTTAPSNIQATGRLDCGPLAPSAHQDVMQFQGGSNLAFVNVVTGDYDGGLATCGGAGGVIYSSNLNNVDVFGGKFITCNHGTTGNETLVNPGGVIQDSMFRSGRSADGSDPNCVGFNGSGPACDRSMATPYVNVVCQNWNPTTDEFVDEP